eukprot:8444544-Prorocentrum_lima.AAC.1
MDTREEAFSAEEAAAFLPGKWPGLNAIMRLSRAAALTILHLAAEKKCEIRDCNQQVTHLSDFLHDDPDDTDLCLAV